MTTSQTKALNAFLTDYEAVIQGQDFDCEGRLLVSVRCYGVKSALIQIGKRGKVEWL